MKPYGELLGRLQQLSSQDRSWIMQQLTDRERAKLLEKLETPEIAPEIAEPKLREAAQPAASSDAKRTDPIKALLKVDPRIVAALLKHEPAWLGAGVLAGQEESWSKAVLDALPASQRSDVERIRSQSFGDELMQSAARQILARCQADVTATSAFDRLVEKISASRSKRRLSLHL